MGTTLIAGLGSCCGCPTCHSKVRSPAPDNGIGEVLYVPEHPEGHCRGLRGLTWGVLRFCQGGPRVLPGGF
jgi:hypothetical protein